MLSDEQLLRYNRQILLPEFDIAGQEKLAAAAVLVLGLGGLGCPAAMYLAASGVGRLMLVDGDKVELSNLQRQVAYNTGDIGEPKALALARGLRALNPDVEVIPLVQRLDEAAMLERVKDVHLVVDASDNFATRFALNRVCFATGVPLVSAAAIRSEGQISLFDPTEGGPCYRCLYDEASDDEELSCSQSGILAPVVGLLGAMQALEAVKYLAGFGRGLHGELLIVDCWSLEIRKLKLKARVDCPVCA